MKVKFNTFDKVNSFVKVASSIDGDIFVRSGRYVVNGSSVMGVYSLDLSKELEVDIFENVEGEANKFIEKIKELNIVIE